MITGRVRPVLLHCDVYTCFGWLLWSDFPLAACIRSPAAYVGMIGSRRKVATMRREFIESGRATEQQWDRIFAPIGLDIGAVTVAEIATSIAAQLVAIRRKGRDHGSAEDMKLR